MQNKPIDSFLTVSGLPFDSETISYLILGTQKLAMCSTKPENVFVEGILLLYMLVSFIKCTFNEITMSHRYSSQGEQ